MMIWQTFNLYNMSFYCEKGFNIIIQESQIKKVVNFERLPKNI